MAWNGNKDGSWGDGGVPAKARGLSPKIKCAIAAAIVVGGSLAAWFALMPASKPIEKPVEKPAKAEKAKPQPKPVKPIQAEAPKPVETPVGKPQDEYVKKPGQLQLPDGKILTFPPPKEGEIRKVYAYGHMYECDHEGNFRDITKRQLFKTAFEGNFLGLAVSGKPFIPAFLTGLDEEDVKRMLQKPYEPIGDETEEELAELKSYDEMRNSALEYMANGGKFDDFVDAFASYVKKERETRATCLREVMTLVKQGKIAEAKEMAEAANILTEQEGFKPIHLPPHVKAAFDELK